MCLHIIDLYPVDKKNYFETLENLRGFHSQQFHCVGIDTFRIVRLHPIGCPIFENSPRLFASFDEPLNSHDESTNFFEATN